MNGFNVKFGYRDNFLGDIKSVEELFPKHVMLDGDKAVINAMGLRHKEVNDMLREAVTRGACSITVNEVFGQRYIGTRLFFPEHGNGNGNLSGNGDSKDISNNNSNGNSKKLKIEINRFPGNDLGTFLNGHNIVVNGNAQDGVGNTMDDGEIVIHGRAGDVVAMSMRGGKIFIRDNVGYRAAIHMKEYRHKLPVLMVGGTAQDFLGEYMAGGIVILLGLGLKEGEPHRANYIGTGMHGGVIYLRGHVEPKQLGREVGVRELDDADWAIITRHVHEYCSHFSKDADEILSGRFIKLIPVSLRPYGNIYAY